MMHGPTNIKKGMIFSLQPTRCNNFLLFISKRLYMLQAGIVDEMELHLIHGTSLQQNWLTIPEAVCTVMCS